MSLPIAEPNVWTDDAEITASRRLGAALMLATDVHVCDSILAGRPVLARRLDAEALRRALRGQPLPDPETYFRVRPGHLDAVAEGGPFDDEREQPMSIPDGYTSTFAPDDPDSRTTPSKPAPLSEKVVRNGEPDTTGQPPPLASAPDILHHLRNDLRLAGLAGEERPAQIIYLCLTSRLLPWGKASNRPVSAIGKGTSSAGKSYTQGTVLKFFPPGAYFDLGSMSKRYLLYTEEELEHRFVVVPEWAQIAEDEEIVAALRTLLSEGRLTHGTVDTEGNRRVARRIEKSGPTGLLMTTTAAITDVELETRCLSFSLDDSRAQTSRIFNIVAEQEQDEFSPVHFESWHELQYWLAMSGENRVVIPFVRQLASLMPNVATRLRRDFVSVLCLIRSHALLHQETRERDDQGRIIATIADYAAVHGLLDEIVSEAVDASVSAATRETVDAVRSLLDVGTDHVSVKRIADVLEVGRSATYDRIRRALAAGFLVNTAKPHERGLKIALGAEMPAGGEFLPSPEVLVRSRPDDDSGQGFGSTMRDSEIESGIPGRPPQMPDETCSHDARWKARDGLLRCLVCEPPAFPSEVVA